MIMNEFDFNITKLKSYLKINNFQSDYSDEELNDMCNLKLNELENMIGLYINPVIKEEYIPTFCSNIVYLDFYPVLEIKQVMGDGNLFNAEDYILQKLEGLIFLKHNFIGELKIIYTVGFTQEQFNSKVQSLLYDIILYTLRNAENQYGEISSITEGNVSISYNSNTSLYTQINNKINNLKNMYHCRCGML